MSAHRLFYAFLPTGEARGAIIDYRNLEAPASIVSDLRLHMTVAIPNDYHRVPTPLIDRLLGAAANVAGAPVSLVLDRLSATGRSIVVRPSRRPATLVNVQEQLQRALASVFGLRCDWTFNPHVTRGYDRRPYSECAIAPIVWTADSVVLVHSHVGTTRHDILGQWRLVDRQGSFAF